MRPIRFQTTGYAAYVGTMPNGDVHFEEMNWDGRRMLVFKPKTREWVYRSNGPIPPPRFKFEAESVGTIPFPTLVHYSCTSVVKRPRRPKLVIHFHGGPESIEFGEKRYGYAFSSLVSDGHRYAAWNYPGSTGFGKDWTALPHGNWERTILTEWIEVESALMRQHRIPKEDWVFVGTSFGATVALLLARFHPWVGKLVLVSPLLSLRHQIERVRRADPSQLSWFRDRFSAEDLRRLDFSESLHEINASISVIASGRDEVLGMENVSRAIRRARAHGKTIDFQVQRGCAHSPKRPSSRRKREQLIRSAVLN